MKSFWPAGNKAKKKGTPSHKTSPSCTAENAPSVVEHVADFVGKRHELDGDPAFGVKRQFVP